MSKISNVGLFKAVYEGVKTYAEKGLIPDTYTAVNVPLYHYTKKQHIVLENGLISKFCADNALKPWDWNPDGDNRFSGASPFRVTIPPRNQNEKSEDVNNLGGLYLFRDENAGIAEMMHYAETPNSRLPVNTKSKRVSIPHLMATQAIFTVSPRKPLRLANLSAERDQANVTRFLNDIENLSTVKNQLGGAKLIDKILDSDDYTVSRAFGLAVYASKYFDGVESPTARESDRPGMKGNNICLFKNNADPFVFLKPEYALLTFSSSMLFDSEGQQIKLSNNDENLINHFIPNATKTDYSIKIEVDSGLKQGMRVAHY